MGTLARILTALVVALLPAGAAAAPGCLACHPAHHREKARCVDCHRGDERTDRRNIAHRDLVPGAYAHFALPDSPVVRRGVGLLEAFACRRCHGWQGRGNVVAADLDDLAAISSPLKIHDAIANPTVFMPDFRFDETQIRDIVNAILAGRRRPGANRGAEIPVVVHFEDSGGRKELLYSRHCGGCHRILSSNWGGLGAGSVGPNLSGLFTPHYPDPRGDGAVWTPERLRNWIRNPRGAKPSALMPPIRLDPEETDALVRSLAADGRRSR